MEAVELAVEARLLMKRVTIWICHSSYNTSRSRFQSLVKPCFLQGGYSVNCVPNGSWVLCGEVFKSEELNDKCATVFYV